MKIGDISGIVSRTKKAAAQATMTAAASLSLRMMFQLRKELRGGLLELRIYLKLAGLLGVGYFSIKPHKAFLTLFSLPF